MTNQANIPPISRSAALVGGVSLLLIAVLAGAGNFGALAPLITSGDAVKTAAAISGSGLQFRIGVLCMILAAILDVVVAAALLRILEPANRMVALTAAWFRIAYAAVFVVAITQLASVPDLLSKPDLALDAIGSYNVIWHVGLMLFAAHLVLVAYVALRSRILPLWLGILVGIAGAGYFVDGVGTILQPDYVPSISTFTFIGEVALIGWLLWTAIRRPKLPLAAAL
jgi:Domain of unknown function (DUF4386)